MLRLVIFLGITGHLMPPCVLQHPKIPKEVSVQQLVRPVIDSLFFAAKDNMPTNKIHDIGTTYDFIIVGSGSAGAVLANRLSENPNWKILLVEVGQPESLFGRVALFGPMLQWSSYNWQDVMEPQDNVCLAMDEKRCPWPKGRALGGSSVINYMIYTRGNRIDYNRWAQQVADTSWRYENVLHYFIKSERTSLKWYDVDYHGVDGYLSTGNVYRTEITDAFLEAGKEMGEEIVDYNGAKQMGFAYMQSTVKKGRRHSVARAFLQPIRDRQNLHILTETRATKILFDGYTATGIHFFHKGFQYRVHATKEVISSAGPFNSPQLLMLSGIGPKEHLRELGIPVLQNLPVGNNLQDHIAYTGLAFLINKTIEPPSDVYNPNLLLQYYKTGEGPLSSIGAIEAIAFIKTNASREIEDYPDIELIFSAGAHHTDYGALNRRLMRISDDYYYRGYKDIEGKPSWTVFPMLLHPKSVGYLRLRSANPIDRPLLYGNYFTDPLGEDKATLIASIRYSIELSKTRAFQKYGTILNPIPVPDCEHFPNNSDDYWNCALERFTVSLHHQTGTCKMGHLNDADAVVTSDFRVRGIHRLRVVDTSVIPFALCAHTNAPTIMIGEKAADVIKATHGFV